MSITRRAVILVLIVLAGANLLARVKVKVQHDKSFSFKALRTYAWHPDGSGDVKVLHNSFDDPKQLRAELDPIIMSAVQENLAKRGFTAATSGTPDLNVYYYVLVGPNTEAQFAGQFLGAVPEWGLPPFSPGTTSLEVYEQGTLLVDLSSPALKSMVWRGSAQAEIDRRRSPAAREKIIRDAIKEMLGKFPPK